MNILRPGAAKTFLDYAQQVFLPYIVSHLQHVGRIDVIWDQYFPDNLKLETRKKRGKRVCRRVEASTAIPGNWQEFLRIDENKTELFTFLATILTLTTSENDKVIISTYNSDVLCNHTIELSKLTPCTHEEADTRIIVHLTNAVANGYNKLSMHTVDTDIVVLAVASVQYIDVTELWIAFGTGRNFQFLAAHEMARALGPDHCIALPMFHAFTGCDTISCFAGRGKENSMGYVECVQNHHQGVLFSDGKARVH